MSTSPSFPFMYLCITSYVAHVGCWLLAGTTPSFLLSYPRPPYCKAIRLLSCQTLFMSPFPTISRSPLPVPNRPAAQPPLITLAASSFACMAGRGGGCEDLMGFWFIGLLGYWAGRRFPAIFASPDYIMDRISLSHLSSHQYVPPCFTFYFLYLCIQSFSTSL